MELRDAHIGPSGLICIPHYAFTFRVPPKLARYRGTTPFMCFAARPPKTLPTMLSLTSFLVELEMCVLPVPCHAVGNQRFVGRHLCPHTCRRFTWPFSVLDIVCDCESFWLLSPSEFCAFLTNSHHAYLPVGTAFADTAGLPVARVISHPPLVW
ncbi:unnamed protein product [Trypanosoma congolense IL3000]|uniref:WGS project CAEQ00000000 data, annotated contig 1206 n=1 Tax=Trypanosoma congolense (strain IL3000) TaxID=1068625 RepID=F9W4N8_TRYCI|nr:unnamed protein product [Trypanosoma congolense IL3000]